MKSLSEFLAKYIIEHISYGPLLPETQKMLRNGIAAYAKHLQEDQPKTAGWAMREKELIIALERMESPVKPVSSGSKCGFETCPYPEFMMHMGCNVCDIKKEAKKMCCNKPMGHGETCTEDRPCAGCELLMIQNEKPKPKYLCPACGHRFDEPRTSKVPGCKRTSCPNCDSTSFEVRSNYGKS